MIHTHMLSFSELRLRMQTHSLLSSSVPVEHAKSLPLPTRRWKEPAYASFASPALRHPGQPLRQGVPDRWWVMSAQNGQLLIYALWNVQPYAVDVEWYTVTLPAETRSVSELQQSLSAIELLINMLAPAFFANEPEDFKMRKALTEALTAHIPEELRPWYRALTPDFFAWLES